MQRLSFLTAILMLILSVAAFAQNSPHGTNLNRECMECHTTDSWDVDASSIKFSHSETGFELTGQHSIVDCKSCHQSLVFDQANNSCFTCHEDIHENSVGKSCENCHSPSTWIVENINNIHEQGRFPLLGNHLTADCQQCHSSSSQLIFNTLGINCVDCHRADFTSTKNPDHQAAGFSTECGDCHQITASSWLFANVVHDFFPLTLGHELDNCYSCHSSQTFAGLSQDCYTCHQNNYQTAAAVDHQKLALSTTCTECHTTNPGWKPAQFTIHDDIYVITGAHDRIRTDCQACHTSGYAGTSDQCFGCHEPNYNATTNPPHQTSNFSTVCENCHTQNAWTPSTFDHDNQYFPIYSGKHNGEWNVCADCHTNQANFQVFSCIDCHEHNKNDTDPEHQGINGYIYESTACYSCHPTGSKEGSFDHASTGFPLTGAHLDNSCLDCHASGFSGTDPACSSCHQDNYNAASNPNHTTLTFGTDCETCHTTEPGWKPAVLPIHGDFYALTGAHSSIANDCESCHQGDYNTKRSDCVDCHLSNYNATTDPDHQALSIPQTCEDCHTTNPGWTPAQFTGHDQVFPLLGAHASEDCSSCHASGYTNTPNTCDGCHLDNYNATSNPDHKSLGIPQTCEDCHTSDPGWKPATFPIHDQYYPLLGAHAQIAADCGKCHNGDYVNNKSLCFDCHENDYNSVSDPKHNPGFPTDCESCHTQSAWKPSTFNHDGQYFPIYSGEHKNEWNNCSECHTNQNDYTAFTCIDCHEHNNKTELDKDHRGVKDYVYTPTSCYDCHPDGKKEEGGGGDD